MMTFDEILDHFPSQGNPDGKGGFMVTCPCHVDTKPSLHISPGNGAGALFYDFGGCPTNAILTEVGLGWNDVSPSRKTSIRSASRVSDEVTRYEIRDPDGKHVATHARKDKPGKEKKVWWERPNGELGLGGIKVAELPLYGVERLVGAPADLPVVVTEGEKAADVLLSNGIVAVGTVTGSSGAPGDEALQQLLDRPVFLWPDNDDGGREHMKRVGAALLRFGHPNVRVIVWPGAPSKDDAADFFQLKGTLEKFHELREMAEPMEQVFLILNRQDPMGAARKFIARYYVMDGVRIIHFHEGQLLAWCEGAYSEIEDAKLRALVYQFLNGASRWSRFGLVPFHPNRSLVEELLSALEAVVYLPKENIAPTWLDGKGPVPANEVIAAQKEILHLPTMRRFSHSPNLFVRNVLPVALPEKPKKAKEWERFLDSIFGKDVESRRTLQEIFGYFLTTDTRQQKIFLIVGPKRSGKGAIARVLVAILGKFNVCGPTLASLTTNFGMSTLVGKQLAIGSGARLGHRTDQHLLAERLLSVSGEDGIDIDRKYKNPLPSVRLSTRFLFLTNELPRISDASGAVASRFIIIPLTESFFGREDHDLERRLLGELPEILGWAIEGWKRLHARGRFVQPPAAEELVRELEDLSSPVGAFLRDMCEREPGARVKQEDLFKAWRLWAHKRGWDHVGTAQTFGRALRAVVPGLKTTRPRGDTGAKVRFYKGIRLKS